MKSIIYTTTNTAIKIFARQFMIKTNTRTNTIKSNNRIVYSFQLFRIKSFIRGIHFKSPPKASLSAFDAKHNNTSDADKYGKKDTTFDATALNHQNLQHVYIPEHSK